VTGRGASPSPGSTGSVVAPQAAGGRGGATGGIMGVASKSKDTSIRLYNGRTHYNEWQFLYVQQVQQAGTGGRGGVPQRGGPGQPPGGIGVPGRGRGGTGRQGTPGGVQTPAAPPGRFGAPSFPGGDGAQRPPQR
jgi:hypothetical protein